MITRIQALGYRCLQHVDARLGPFQVLVGRNATGKSTLLDVAAFIRDLVEARTVREALVLRTAGFEDLLWMRQGDHFELAIETLIPHEKLTNFSRQGFSHCRLELAIGMLPESGEIGILTEVLRIGKPSRPKHRQLSLFPASTEPPETILWGHSKAGWKQLLRKNYRKNDNYTSEIKDWNPTFALGSFNSALANLPADKKRFLVATWFRDLFRDNVQTIMLSSEAIRRPSPPGQPLRFLPDGSNLPWVVQELIARNEQLFGRWLEHVRTVFPDIVGIETVDRPEDKHRYLVVKYENGLRLPAWGLSDGTVRFLALTILPYLQELSGILLIEEPENGIHPTAVEAVFRSLSSVAGAQVLVATHSPILLSVAKLDQLLCFGKTEEGATDIVSGEDHPALKNWRGDTSLGALLAGGVLG